MECFIAKLAGSAGSEKEVKVPFYSASAKNQLDFYRKNEITLGHKDMYEILADAYDRQKYNAKREGITPTHIGNTQRGINRFLEEAPQEERYRIKEFAPCPENNKK